MLKKKQSNKIIPLLILFTAFSICGCVKRTVTITSVPQGASVYFDNKYVGETPVEFNFNFYGGHHLELTKQGYENYKTTIKLKAPAYQYIPIDFITECILPWKLHDSHRAEISLKEGASRPPSEYKKIESEKDKKDEEQKEEKTEKDKLFE